MDVISINCNNMTGGTADKSDLQKNPITIHYDSTTPTTTTTNNNNNNNDINYNNHNNNNNINIINDTQNKSDECSPKLQKLQFTLSTNLQYGDSIEIIGSVGQDKFLLDFLSDYLAFDPSITSNTDLDSVQDDINLCTVLTQPLQIQLETNGSWDINAISPETSTSSHGSSARRYGFRHGNKFTCKIEVKPEFYVVYLNDMILSNSEHLVPVGSINGFSVDGDCFITHILFGNPTAVEKYKSSPNIKNKSLKPIIVECRLTSQDSLSAMEYPQVVNMNYSKIVNESTTHSQEIYIPNINDSESNDDDNDDNDDGDENNGLHVFDRDDDVDENEFLNNVKKLTGITRASSYQLVFDLEDDWGKDEDFVNLNKFNSKLNGTQEKSKSIQNLFHHNELSTPVQNLNNENYSQFDENYHISTSKNDFIDKQQNRFPNLPFTSPYLSRNISLSQQLELVIEEDGELIENDEINHSNKNVNEIHSLQSIKTENNSNFMTKDSIPNSITNYPVINNIHTNHNQSINSNLSKSKIPKLHTTHNNHIHNNDNMINNNSVKALKSACRSKYKNFKSIGFNDHRLSLPIYFNNLNTNSKSQIPRSNNLYKFDKFSLNYSLSNCSNYVIDDETNSNKLIAIKFTSPYDIDNHNNHHYDNNLKSSNLNHKKINNLNGMNQDNNQNSNCNNPNLTLYQPIRLNSSPTHQLSLKQMNELITNINPCDYLNKSREHNSNSSYTQECVKLNSENVELTKQLNNSNLFDMNGKYDNFSNEIKYVPNQFESDLKLKPTTLLLNTTTTTTTTTTTYNDENHNMIESNNEQLTDDNNNHKHIELKQIKSVHKNNLGTKIFKSSLTNKFKTNLNKIEQKNLKNSNQNENNINTTTNHTTNNITTTTNNNNSNNNLELSSSAKLNNKTYASLMTNSFNTTNDLVSKSYKTKPFIQSPRKWLTLK